MNKGMKTLGLLLLSASLVLTACGDKKTETTASSSTTRETTKSKKQNKKVKATSSSRASTSTSETSTSTTTTGSTTETAASSSTQASSSTPASSATTTSSSNITSSIDAEAIAKGDFTTLVGTWEDGKGNQIIIDKNGPVSQTMYNSYTDESNTFTDVGYSYLRTENGIITGSTGSKAHPTQAAFIIIPSGVDGGNLGPAAEMDRLAIGQSFDGTFYTRVGQ